MSDWYYADATNTRQGPVTTPALLQLRQQGAIGDATLLWREGLGGWLPLRELAHELGDAPAPVASEVTSANAGAHAIPEATAAPVDAQAGAVDHGAGRSPPAPAAGAPARAALSDASPYTPPTSTVAHAHTVVHGGAVVDAGFLKRAAALCIDSLVVTAAYYALIVVAMIVFGLSGALTGLASGNPDFGAGAMGLVGVIYLSYPVISGLYYVAMESSSRQATLGKMAVGIKVTGLDGARISRGRALGRWASHLVSYLTLYIGYLVVLFTRRKQGLHDMVASTCVVDQWAYTEFPERQQRTLGTVATVILVIWAAMILLAIVFVVLAGILSTFGS